MSQSLDLEGLLITISSVELPPDMKQAYVYVSTLNPEVEQETALKLLNRNRARWQSVIGRRLGHEIHAAADLPFRHRRSSAATASWKSSPSSSAAAGSRLPRRRNEERRRQVKRATGKRHDGRRPDQLRPFKFQPGIAPHAAGSVLASCGRTQVICAVTIEEIGAALDEGAAGHGRLDHRRVFDAALLDAGPETARHQQGPARRPQHGNPAADRPQRPRRGGSAGARLAHDLHRLRRARGRRRHAHDGHHGNLRGAGARRAEVCARKGLLSPTGKSPIHRPFAAISVGMVEGRPVLDLDYVEDKDARDRHERRHDRARPVTSRCRPAARKAPFRRGIFRRCSRLAQKGIKRLGALQQAALG